ncbi:Similar to gb/X79273 cytochrome c reductase hinge protein subunit from Solanum tuberosum. ESTs gb/T45282 and gb/T21596 come from this gene [Arabidopsis thaliana]|nr:Similar to gb/X79273 cytochrome c reductase hinge protein subunit from Solanum tuberosum. ESTs gb/T45282 and gb/T21596 come from this gene [Arabidopsis thaliana]
MMNLKTDSNNISVGADDEVVDPKKYLEESCKPKCVKPLLEYQACVKRIQGDDSGHKHCTGQYFDYWQCIDKCVSCTKAVCETKMKRGEAGDSIVLSLLHVV